MTAREITELTGYVFRSGYVQIEIESLLERRNDILLTLEEDGFKSNAQAFYRKLGKPNYHKASNLSEAFCPNSRAVIMITQYWADVYTQGCSVGKKRIQHYYVNIYKK